MGEWSSDVLGDGFERLELSLGEDEEGPLVATLVRTTPAPLSFWQRLRGARRMLEDVDVLYVHGWNDYFFQRRMARFFTDRGARFFALDLRNYGRSLRDGQLPGYIEDFADYDLEIGLALEVMGHPSGSASPPSGVENDPNASDGASRASVPGSPASADAGELADVSAVVQPGTRNADPRSFDAWKRPGRRLLLYGHSTGGLVLSLWSDRHPGVADGLLLNSPWLALQLGGAVRRALAPVVNLRARFAPHDLALPQLDFGFYHEAQRRVSDADEQALIEPLWRASPSPPVRAGWLKAVLQAHLAVEAGIEVGAPVCVLLSQRSLFALSWKDEMLRSDTVIDVDGVAKAAVRLGRSLTIERIEGALHNVFLSEPAVREEAYARVDRWLRGWSSGLAR